MKNMLKLNLVKVGLSLAVLLSFLVPVNVVQADIIEHFEAKKESKDIALRTQSTKEDIAAARKDLKREVSQYMGRDSQWLRSFFSGYGWLHWNERSSLQDVIASTEAYLEDEQIEFLVENLKKQRRLLKDLHDKRTALKKKIAQHNFSQTDAADRISDDVDSLFERNSLIITDDEIKMTVQVDGQDRLVPFDMNAQEFEGRSVAKKTAKKSADSSATVASTKKHRSLEGYGDEDEDKDENKTDDCADGSCNEPERKSGVHPFTRNMLPILGMLGVGYAGYSNYRLKKDMLKTGNNLISDARANGQNPYMYLGLMKGAMNYDPFRFLGDSMAPIMMSISEGYGNNNGKSSFQDYYRRKMLLKAIQARAGQQNGNSSVSTSQTQNIEITQAIKSLNQLSNIFPTQDQLLDLMEKRLGNFSKELNGGMTSRNRQDLYSALTNFQSRLQTADLVEKNSKMMIDQMRMMNNQFKTVVENGNEAMNRDGGLRTSIQRTITDNSSSNWNGQGQTVGNPGVSFMPGQQVMGGGGGQQFIMPQGGNNGLRITAGGNSNGVGGSFTFN